MPLGLQNAQIRNIMLVFGLIIAAILGLLAVLMSGTGSLTGSNIAVIPIKGEITLDSANTIVKTIEEADKDVTISAIILDINSPGGTVVASREIADAVKSTKKPVVAWIREVGASGAYWVASASDMIVADPSSMTGSIGVIGSYLQFSKLMENYGVTYERLVSGAYKDEGSQYKELTPEERANLQKKIGEIKDMFVAEVAANRGMTPEAVTKLATGEVFLGTEAQDNGLVDILGGKDVAQKTAETLAGITNSKLVDRGQQSSLLSLLGVNAIAYNLGKGIGSGLNPLTDANTQFTLMAEMQ